MATKKQKLKELNSLKGGWSAAHISINYKAGLLDETIIQTPIDAFNIVDAIWNRELINLQEQFVALYFNGNNQLIGWRLISNGDTKSVVVHIKIIVSLALQSMASGVIIAHNHPSGNLLPSKSDEVITERLKSALMLIDIKLLDHVILTDNGYLSMKEEGML